MVEGEGGEREEGGVIAKYRLPCTTLASACAVLGFTSARPQASLPAVSEQKIDRLPNAMPASSKGGPDAENIRNEQRALLIAVNPGREADLEKPINTYVECVDTVSQQASERTIKSTLSKMTPLEIDRLITFFERELRGYADAVTKYKVGRPLNAEEKVLLQKVSSDASLQQWETRFHGSVQEMIAAKSTVNALTLCSTQKNDALIAAHLNYRREQ